MAATKKEKMYEFMLTSGAMIDAPDGGLEPIHIERGADPVKVSVTRKLGNTLDQGGRGYWLKGPPDRDNRIETATAEDEDTRGPGAKKKGATRGPTGV
jgi:hypothetical protein